MPVFETPGSVELQIRLPAGHVVLNTTDEATTRVDLVPKGRRGDEAIEQITVEAQERPGGHLISIERRDRIRFGPISIDWGEGDIEVRVTCPHGADLEFNGASADLSASGRFGRVGAKTASGDLRLGIVGGKLQVKTASGAVSVQGVEADANVVTVSGDVDIEGIEAELTARTVSGDVAVGRVCAPLTLSTTSGDVALKVVERGDVRIQSVSGDTRIGVAQGIGVWLDASSLSGDLKSELADVQDVPADSEGEIVPLRVKSVSGDVSFVRAARPE
jgi:DUF4097 and DUF4098 domain-containing protein YvlB